MPRGHIGRSGITWKREDMWKLAVCIGEQDVGQFKFMGKCL